MRRVRLLVLAVVCALVLESSALIQPQASIGSGGIIPAPTGFYAPYIDVNPHEGYAGQNILVTGGNVSAYPSVRIAWLIDEATQTAATAVRQSNAYTATITVPDDAVPGLVQLCATVAGTTQSEFNCIPFRINPLPPGSVSGQLPISPTLGHQPQTFSAFFKLLDNAGTEVASTIINPDGSFSVGDVPPGVYSTGIFGTVPTLYDSPVVKVKPAVDVTQPIRLFADCGGAKVESIGANLASLSAIHFMASGLSLEQELGTYISGVTLNVTFSATLQSVTATTVYSVAFDIKTPDGTRFNIGNAASAPYRTTYNVGLLPAGTSTLYAKVYTEFGTCTKRAPIYVIANPMSDPNIQPGGVTTWNAGTKRYDFNGMIPNVGGVLPLIYTTPSLPLVGALENKLSAGLYFQGDLALNGLGHINIINATALARLMNIDLYNKTQPLLDWTKVTFNRTDPTSASMPIGERTLFSFDKDVPVFSGPLASFWGIVTIKASVSVGIGGDLKIKGTLYPLKPAADVILTPSASPRLTVSVWVDLLLGIASAGADATAEAKITLPLHIDTEASPIVKFDQICLKFKVVLSAWARINLLFKKKTWNLGSYDLVNYNPCGLTLARSVSAATLAVSVPPPSVMASPSIATSPGGQTIAVYVVNTSAVVTPTMRIAANFWDTQNNTWGNTMYLSDGSHAVQDPVVTWATDPETPFVAWTETMLTAAEENAITSTTDINAYLKRQEIFARSWITQTQWSAPTRLTNDLSGDGRPSITDYYDDLNNDYIFLAWTKDVDGNVFTRTDSRIAVARWDKINGWLNAGLLAAPTLSSTTSNSQVSASANALAWTVDYDGDIDTNADRHIAIAGFNSIMARFNTAQASTLKPDRSSAPKDRASAAPELAQDWTIVVPSSLPVGAESPSLYDFPQPERLQLTFLVRGTDGDTVTNTGLGNRSALWTAYFDSGNLVWQAAPVLDNQAPVYAETPKLQFDGQGRSYLIFRRFGEAGTLGELGQVALTVGTFNSTDFARPLNLTGDDLRQHWQPAFTIDPGNQALNILNVSRAATTNATDLALLQRRWQPTDRSAQMKIQPQALTATDDPVEAFSLSLNADPAIDAVDFSQQHAALNTQLAVTTTIRNLGAEPAYAVVVKVYRIGTLLALAGTYTVTGPLNFNESVTFSLPLTKTEAAQTVSVLIESSSQNNDPYNDVKQIDLQTLPAPTFVGVAESPIVSTALDVAWLPSNASGVAGYRILRSPIITGTYELAGEAINPAYTDRLLQRGQSYCYLVQAYDANGVLSADSDPSCATVSYLKVFLPIMLKAH
jgi:hypothetical protein